MAENPRRPHVSGLWTLQDPTMQALAVSREIFGKLGMSIDKCPFPRSQGQLTVFYSEILTEVDMLDLKVNSATKITSLKVIRDILSMEESASLIS